MQKHDNVRTGTKQYEQVIMETFEKRNKHSFMTLLSFDLSEELLL